MWKLWEFWILKIRQIDKKKLGIIRNMNVKTVGNHLKKKKQRNWIVKMNRKKAEKYECENCGK